MLNLRIAFQKCVRRASILGHSPICHQTSRSSNVIYVSRQTFADGNIEVAENASRHSEMKHLTEDSTNLESNTNSEVAENASIPVPKDLTEFSHSIANTALDTAQNPGENSITVDGFTKEVTEESLKEFYSQFGQVVGCTIGTDLETGRQNATVEFSSKEAVNRLNNRFFLNSRSNKERMPTSRTSPEGMFDGELVDVVGEPKSNRSQSIAVDKEVDPTQTRLKNLLESDDSSKAAENTSRTAPEVRLTVVPKNSYPAGIAKNLDAEASQSMAVDKEPDPTQTRLKSFLETDGSGKVAENTSRTAPEVRLTGVNESLKYSLHEIEGTIAHEAQRPTSSSVHKPNQSNKPPPGMFDDELVDMTGEPKANRNRSVPKNSYPAGIAKNLDAKASQSMAVDKEPDQTQTRLKNLLESDGSSKVAENTSRTAPEVCLTGVNEALKNSPYEIEGTLAHGQRQTSTSVHKPNQSKKTPPGMFDEVVDMAGEPKANRNRSIVVDKELDPIQSQLKSFLESDGISKVAENTSRTAPEARLTGNAITITIPIDFVKSLLDMVNYSQDANRTISMTAAMPPQGIANEPKAVKSSSIAESKASNPTKSSNKLDFRRYHIWACGFSENVTEDMLREFYSRFGEVVSCSVRKQRNGEMSAVVAFSSKKAMNRALQSVQHRINNERVFVTVWTGPHELELRLLNLSPKTTEESLKKFYSKFGKVTRCALNKAPRPSYVIFASHDDLDRALDAQPHVIDGSEVFLKYASGELDLIIKNVPEGITEESLRTHFSQYGQLRQCELLKTSDGNKHGYVSFSAIDEVNRAIEDRPHIIDQKILRTEFLNKSCSFSLFVGSLPENATLESLFNAFSKFGKIVYLELHNDGGMNQRGPYGFVSYGTKQEADNALNTRPYKVDGSIVYVRIASQKHDEYNKKSSPKIAF
ncbi:RNA recognition motif domain-containing protein [Ditylenchus destructor]|uniref:RNA recognition motif domain-containing protein n=1 Tax=Ditylenchus destructor TaxID=166010 RepID=A0AAD4MTU2_9BILA|nr:RNA recognition motif domain-containing protein [Ditylenchus destructor]